MGKAEVPRKRESSPPPDAELDIDIPELPSEQEEVTLATYVRDDFDYEVAADFGFIGIGQAGTRIARTFHSLGYRRVAVIDGASQDLLDVPDEIARLDLGIGMAKNIEAGAKAVQERTEEIIELMGRSLGTGLDCILVCGSLGGGTGSGALPHVIGTARNYMRSINRPVRVGAVVALPMPVEGSRLASNAITTLKKLAEIGPSPWIIIDNQRIQDLFKVGTTKIYQKCNEQTVKLFHLFNQLAGRRSQFITFDRAEFASLLDKGVIAFGAGNLTQYNTPTAVASSVRRQLSETVLLKADLSTGTEAGCIFTGSEEVLDSVPIDVFDGGFSMLGRTLRPGAIVHRGIYKGTSPVIRCFTLISGLELPKARLLELSKLAGNVPCSTAKYLGIDD